MHALAKFKPDMPVTLGVTTYKVVTIEKSICTASINYRCLLNDCNLVSTPTSGSPHTPTVDLTFTSLRWGHSGVLISYLSPVLEDLTPDFVKSPTLPHPTHGGGVGWGMTLIHEL